MSDASGRPLNCAFCGDSPLTKEHIFAAWVDDALPYAAASFSQVAIYSDTVALTFEALPFEQKVRAVCADCNNKWMSKLEAEAGAVLAPMVSIGLPVILTPQMQRLISTWAMKTALMLQYLRPEARIVSDNEYREFYSRQEPLPQWLVYIAYRRSIMENGSPVWAAARSSAVPTIRLSESIDRDWLESQVAAGNKIYRLAFTLGHVAFLAFGHTLRGKMLVPVGSALQQVIHQIWPPQRDIAWPPPVPIEAMGGVDGLHNAIGGKPRENG